MGNAEFIGRQVKGKRNHSGISVSCALRSKFCTGGFTLIEISIVIFIILLMTSAAVPWMRTFAESSRLRTAARGIRSLLEFARSSSITQRTEYVIMFDSANGEYWLSLQELLENTSGGEVIDASRTALTESLESLNNLDDSDDSNDQSVAGQYSRTGGILGIPRQFSNGIEIVRIISPRESSGNEELSYVTFYPDGTAEDFEVYLQGGSGRTFLISITESTGRTKIQELTDEEIEELGLQIED